MSGDDPFDLSKSLSQFDAQWDDLLSTTRSSLDPQRKKNQEDKKKKEEGKNEEAVEEEEEESSESDDEELDDESIATREQKKETLTSLGGKLSVLVSQLEDLRFKYKKSLDQNQRLNDVNKELVGQIDTLEEENTELQEALKEKLEDAKRNKLMGGSYGADKKRGGARNKNANAANKKESVNILSAINDDGEHENLVDITIGGQTKSVIEKFSQQLFDYVPFKRDIQELRSTFGGATAAYFSFFRWVLFDFIVMGLFGILFSTIHIVRMVLRGDGSSVVTGDSFLPGFMNYSSFNTGEGFQYTCNVVLGLALLLFSNAHKTIMEDRQMKRLDVIEQQDNFSFSKDILCRWDNSQNQKQEVDHSYGLIYLAYKEKLAEHEKQHVASSRSAAQRAILYSKRFLVFILYCCIQVASYATIIRLTIQSGSIQDYFSGVPGLRSLTAFIVPGAVTSINAMTPFFYKHLTKFEEWNSGQFSLNILISRMYLSNIMNLLILALSYGLLADPYLLSTSSESQRRAQLENTFEKGVFTCRLNAAAEGLFRLVMSEFVVNGIIFFGVGFLPDFINRRISPSFKRFEMNIAQRMVALLYFISLMLLAFPFSPLVVIFMPIIMSIRIKWEKTLTLRYYVKPKDVWQAHKSGSYFLLFYLISLTLVALPAMLLFMSQHTFAKNCDIQDNFIGLCASSVSAANNTCILDTSSEYYDYFSDSANCPEGYPACVCDYSCGPFINQPNAFQAARGTMYSLRVLKIIWRYCIAPAYLAWWLVGAMYVFSRLRKNTIAVNDAVHKEEEKALTTQIMSLENEAKRHTKLINRLKLLEK